MVITNDHSHENYWHMNTHLMCYTTTIAGFMSRVNRLVSTHRLLFHLYRSHLHYCMYIRMSDYESKYELVEVCAEVGDVSRQSCASTSLLLRQCTHIHIDFCLHTEDCQYESDRWAHPVPGGTLSVSFAMRLALFSLESPFKCLFTHFFSFMKK